MGELWRTVAHVQRLSDKVEALIPVLLIVAAGCVCGGGGGGVVHRHVDELAIEAVRVRLKEADERDADEEEEQREEEHELLERYGANEARAESTRRVEQLVDKRRSWLRRKEGGFWPRWRRLLVSCRLFLTQMFEAEHVLAVGHLCARSARRECVMMIAASDARRPQGHWRRRVRQWRRWSRRSTQGVPRVVATAAHADCWSAN